MPLPYPSLLGYTRVVTNNGPVILFLLWKDAKDSVFESSRYYSSVICPKPTVNVDKDKDETELSDQQTVVNGFSKNTAGIFAALEKKKKPSKTSSVSKKNLSQVEKGKETLNNKLNKRKGVRLIGLFNTIHVCPLRYIKASELNKICHRQGEGYWVDAIQLIWVIKGFATAPNNVPANSHSNPYPTDPSASDPSPEQNRASSDSDPSLPSSTTNSSNKPNNPVPASLQSVAPLAPVVYVIPWQETEDLEKNQNLPPKRLELYPSFTATLREEYVLDCLIGLLEDFKIKLPAKNPYLPPPPNPSNNPSNPSNPLISTNELEKKSWRNNNPNDPNEPNSPNSSDKPTYRCSKCRFLLFKTHEILTHTSLLDDPDDPDNPNNPNNPKIPTDSTDDNPDSPGESGAHDRHDDLNNPNNPNYQLYVQRWGRDVVSEGPGEYKRSMFTHKKYGVKGSPCGSYFLTVNGAKRCFGESQFEENEGNLTCLKCKNRLGYFCWSGAQCSCGKWIVPSIQIVKSRVDLSSPAAAVLPKVIRPKFKNNRVTRPSIRRPN